MGLLRLLFGTADTQPKKTRAQLAHEHQERERHLWELAEEYADEE